MSKLKELVEKVKRQCPSLDPSSDGGFHKLKLYCLGTGSDAFDSVIKASDCDLEKILTAFEGEGPEEQDEILANVIKKYSSNNNQVDLSSLDKAQTKPSPTCTKDECKKHHPLQYSIVPTATCIQATDDCFDTVPASFGLQDENLEQGLHDQLKFHQSPCNEQTTQSLQERDCPILCSDPEILIVAVLVHSTDMFIRLMQCGADIESNPGPSGETVEDQHPSLQHRTVDPNQLLMQSGDIEPNPGPGFEAKFVHPLLERHECPICLYAMKNPVQTECGHLFCCECLKPVLRRRRSICSLDKEEISQEGIFPDNACRREILNLEVYCNYVAGGCSWVGHLKDLQAHIESCEHREIQCIQCGQDIQALFLKSHQDVECPMRPELCPHCHQEVPSQQMEDHNKKVCPEMLHLCPNGCNPKLEMKLPELQRHLAVRGGDCPLSEVPCPYVTSGCTFVSLRKNLPAHMDQYQVYHVQLQQEALMEMRSNMEKNAATMQHLMERVGSLESRTNAIERLQDAIEQRVELLDERKDRHVDRYETKIATLEEQTTRTNNILTQLSRKVEELHISGAGAYTGGGINYSTVSSGYGTKAQPPATSSHLQGMGPPASNIAAPQRVEQLQGRVVEVEHGIDQTLSSCLDQELRIQLLERATYNGVLIWKIDEFERRRKEAIDGATMSLYSSPFYTGRQGYKMCCRVYLNGDGLGKGTHLSLFFVIMRGPFDALLDWPFKQKVTVTLLNQNGRRPVSDSFQPDGQSSSFQHPLRREMNIASGCPLFVKISHLLNGGFVKDDCIYLRAVVDTTDLPTYPSL